MDGPRPGADRAPMTTDLSPTQVDLAHEPAFDLGDVRVEPATSEIVWGGNRETLQPKVMQVLVALAARRGAVMSQRDLIDACWGGRAVGDDAVQRCIGQIRRVAERTGAFQVETLPRVGYRLIAETQASPAPRRRAALWAGLALIAVVVAALLGLQLLRGPEPDAPPHVQVSAFQTVGDGAAARTLAQTLADEIPAVLSESGIPTLPARSVGGLRLYRPDLAIGGTVEQRGDVLRVRVFLEDPKAAVTLWTAQFERPASQADGLRDEIAAAVGDTLYTALEPSQQKGMKLDAQTLALHLRGSEYTRSPQYMRPGEGRRAFEQAIARAPGFALDHGNLAVVLSVDAEAAQGAARADLLRRARAEAATAIQIDPAAAGAGYDALALISRAEAPRDPAAMEDIILDGLRRAPEFPDLLMRECRFLVDVGRGTDAMPYCQRALAVRPLAGPIGYSYARGLRATGLTAVADEAMERAARLNPDHRSTRAARLEFALFGGSPDDAEALLRSPRTRPQQLGPEAVAALEAFLRARRTGGAQDADAALAAAVAAMRAEKLPVDLTVKVAASLGRVDAAFAILEGPAFARWVDLAGAAVLTDPATMTLRRDPRYWPVAADAGLVAYWTKRGKWPDFCGREIDLSVCRSQAGR